jgi:hypothetical protein
VVGVNKKSPAQVRGLIIVVLYIFDFYNTAITVLMVCPSPAFKQIGLATQSTVEHFL